MATLALFIRKIRLNLKNREELLAPKYFSESNDLKNIFVNDFIFLWIKKC